MPGVPKPTFSGMTKTVTEAVIKPAGDQLAEAVEQGVSDTFGISVKPIQNKKPFQQDPTKKADEDRKRQNILRYFDSLKVNASSYKQRQDAATQQVRQKELDEKQKVQQFQFVEMKKNQRTDVYRAQRKAEIKVKGG